MILSLVLVIIVLLIENVFYVQRVLINLCSETLIQIRKQSAMSFELSLIQTEIPYRQKIVGLKNSRPNF